MSAEARPTGAETDAIEAWLGGMGIGAGTIGQGSYNQLVRALRSTETPSEGEAVGFVVLVTKTDGVQYAVNDFPARLSNCRAVVARKRDSEHTYTIHPVGRALSPVEPEDEP